MMNNLAVIELIMFAMKLILALVVGMSFGILKNYVFVGTNNERTN